MYFGNLTEKENIKLVISDFDGVFTDCTGIVDFCGNVSKRINYQDVLAIALLIRFGIKVAIITGEHSGAVDYLKKKFPELDTFQDIKNKLPVVREYVSSLGLTGKNVLYVGDDVNDAESLMYSGVRVTVPNANQMIKDIKNIIITEKSGGQGVIREITDALIGERIKMEFCNGELNEQVY